MSGPTSGPAPGPVRHHIAPHVRVCLADHALLREKLLKVAPDDAARVRVANAMRAADEAVRTACLAAGVMPVEAPSSGAPSGAPAPVVAIPTITAVSLARETAEAGEDGPDAA